MLKAGLAQAMKKRSGNNHNRIKAVIIIAGWTLFGLFFASRRQAHSFFLRSKAIDEVSNEINNLSIALQPRLHGADHAAAG